MATLRFVNNLKRMPLQLSGRSMTTVPVKPTPPKPSIPAKPSPSTPAEPSTPAPPVTAAPLPSDVPKGPAKSLADKSTEYQTMEYYQYNPMSYYDIDSSMRKHRLAQPSKYTPLP